MNKVILASASPRRRELLTQIGMEYEVIPARGEEKLPQSRAKGSADCAADCGGECSLNCSADCGESSGGGAELPPSEIVEILSAQKAEEVFERLLKEKRSFFTVIGADTVVALEGEVMGKPGSHAYPAPGKEPSGLHRGYADCAKRGEEAAPAGYLS